MAALTSLSLSTAVATILLIYLCGFSGSVKDKVKGTTRANGKRSVPQLGEDAVANRAAQRKKTRLSFWKWNVGERFVVYLGSLRPLPGNKSLPRPRLHNPRGRQSARSHLRRLCLLPTQFYHLPVVRHRSNGRQRLQSDRLWSQDVARSLRLETSCVRVRSSNLISVTALSLGLLGASGAW